MQKIINKHEQSSDTQRRCTRFLGACEDCKIECPYPFCQHINCAQCKQKAFCPMCEADCTKCPDATLCSIWKR